MKCIDVLFTLVFVAKNGRAISGSGFKSALAYRNGYFGVSIKVQPGYTAGVNTAFYVSNPHLSPFI
jgi:hypothetical protein